MLVVIFLLKFSDGIIIIYRPGARGIRWNITPKGRYIPRALPEGYIIPRGYYFIEFPERKVYKLYIISKQHQNRATTSPWLMSCAKHPRVVHANSNTPLQRGIRLLYHNWGKLDGTPWLIAWSRGTNWAFWLGNLWLRYNIRIRSMVFGHIGSPQAHATHKTASRWHYVQEFANLF